MKYILREIDSKEEFIKTFGQNPKWIFSPVRMTTRVKSEEVRKVTSEKSGDKHQDGVSDDETNLLD